MIKKYEHYKDSGVEWLGEIPEHWELLSGKRFHKVKKNLNSGRKCDNVLSLTLRGVVNNNPDSPEGMVPKDYATYQTFNQYDLVFKLIDLENVRTSRVGIVHEKGIMSSAYIRLIIGSNNFSRYAFYYYFNLYLNQVYNNLGSGVRSTLGPNDLLNIPYIKPPLPEQTAIANFLDDKTTKINQAIAIKQQQIALLKERKQILIHKAVTRGLNDKVALKDSGVEWIGEIPEHWDLRQIKNVANTVSGGTPSSGNRQRFYNGKYPWIRTTDLNNDVLYEVPEAVTELALKETACKLIPKNSICVAMYGGSGTIGKYSMVAIKNATLNQAVCGIIANNKIDHFFLYYLVQMMRPHWMFYADGSRKDPNISQDVIRNMPIPLPSIPEQKEIAQYIETASSKIETAISIKEQEIEKLQEYKSSLINSVVTGKVKIIEN